jgi:hypothetical protein
LAYDTICHEHIEYYGLKQIRYIAEKSGLKIIDVEFNDINGGSFYVTLAKKESNFITNTELIENILYFEENWNSLDTFKNFKNAVENHRKNICNLFRNLQKYNIYGYGASTKGNVLLQYCGITINNIKKIVEINEDKFGKVTPGSNIPIISEKEIDENIDYYMVLPWHFREDILRREKNKTFIFPLPEINVVNT